MSCSPTPPLKLLTIAILAVLPALSAYAGPQAAPQQQDSRQVRDSGQARDGRQDRGNSRDNSSLSDAVRRIERDTRGEVLSAERVQYDGRDMHRVKVVDDAGRVRVFMQDPSRRDDTPRASQNNGRNDDRNDGKGARGSQQEQRPARPTRDRDD